MHSKTLRARAVRQALAHPAGSMPSCHELNLLTQFILGQRTREDLNDQLLLGDRLHLLATR